MAMATAIYNYCLSLRETLKTERQGIELIQAFHENVFMLCTTLNGIVKPYDLKFRSIRFPQNIMSQFTSQS